jgi:hypothetical protein
MSRLHRFTDHPGARLSLVCTYRPTAAEVVRRLGVWPSTP